MCKGQEERERGTEVPRSKRNKNVLAEVAKVYKERLIGFARKRRKGRSWAGAWTEKKHGRRNTA